MPNPHLPAELLDHVADLHQQFYKSADRAWVMKPAEPGPHDATSSACRSVLKHVQHHSTLSTISTSKHNRMDLLCDCLKCVIIYVFVYIEPSISVQAAQVAVRLRDHTLFMNRKEVYTPKHRVEMDDGVGAPVVCGVLRFHNPHPRDGVWTPPF